MAILLPLFAWFVFCTACVGAGHGLRKSLIGSFTIVAVLVVFVAESLSLLRALTPLCISIAWLAITIVGVVVSWRLVPQAVSRIRRDRLPAVCWKDVLANGAILSFVVAVLAAAVLYPTMNYDSQTYHMPRVFFWLENGSVHPYPTPEARQLFSSVVVEYFVVQMKALAGNSDRVANLVQWLSYTLSAIAASLIAQELGAHRRGQQAAALAAIAIPMAGLQGSTTQNDLTTALWCLVAIYAAILYVEADNGTSAGLMYAAWTGAALGLAVQSKATAVIVLAPMLLWLAWRAYKARKTRVIEAVGIAAASILLVCSGPYLRNYSLLDGDWLGTRAPGNAHVLVKDRTPGGLLTLAVKNSMMMMGTPSVGVNQAIARGAGTAVTLYGGDINDRSNDEPGWGVYVLPTATFAHDTAPAPLSAALIAVSGFVLLALRFSRRRHKRSPSESLGGPDSLPLGYLAASAVAALLLAAAVTWNPFVNRILLLPLLVATPLAGVALSLAVRQNRRMVTTLLLIMLTMIISWGAIVIVFNDTNRLVSMSVLPGRGFVRDTGHWNTRYEDLDARATEGKYERAFDRIEEIAKKTGARRIGLHASVTDVPIYPLLRRLDGYEVRYVENTVLPTRIPPPRFAADLVVRIVSSENAYERPGVTRDDGGQVVCQEIADGVVISAWRPSVAASAPAWGREVATF